MKEMKSEKMIEILHKCYNYEKEVYKQQPDEKLGPVQFNKFLEQMFKTWALKDLKRNIKLATDYKDLCSKCKISARLGKGCASRRELKQLYLSWRVGFVDIFLDEVKNELEKTTI